MSASEISQVRKCELCPKDCYCVLFNNTQQVTLELAKQLSNTCTPPLLKKYNLVLDGIGIPVNPEHFAQIDVHNINTKSGKSIVFTIGDKYGSGQIRHKIFLDVFSLTMAPLSHILNSKNLSKRLKTFNVVLNGDAMFEFYVNPLKQDSTTIKINMAQERHFDESGELKDGAIELAFLEALNDFDFMPMIEAITFEQLRPKMIVYYIYSDLPQDKIPVAVYFKETIEQLNGISPFTRKRFNPIDVKEYVVPEPKELVELRRDMRIKQLPPLQRMMSNPEGRECISRQQGFMQRCLTQSDDKHYPDGFTPRFRKDVESDVLNLDNDSPCITRQISQVVESDVLNLDDDLPPLPPLTRQNSQC